MTSIYGSGQTDIVMGNVAEYRNLLREIMVEANQSAAYWNGPEQYSFKRIAEMAASKIPLDIHEKYVTNKVEGEDLERYLGDF